VKPPAKPPSPGPEPVMQWLEAMRVLDALRGNAA
jgi:hypothetical protein